ncbi:MAG TPA: hypothetical protein VGP47_06465 [Parachlamydiaceae bacterium]|nr:hypothetical protein [Parachlamydiaceae bacterium]
MTSTSLLRVGSGTELPLQASKWLDLQLLIDIDEMRDLFTALGDFEIFQVGMVCGINEGIISKQKFLEVYEAYIECLKKGEIPEEKIYRPYFSSIFTTSHDHLFHILIGNDRHIIRVEKPVLQMQANRISYSQADGKIRPMVFSKDSILWGLQFSYPQLFQDSVTKEVFTVSDTLQFPNTPLYRKLQLFLRQNTIPTPFEVSEGQDNVRINVPMRLGRKCLSWINSHPQLADAGMRVIT